MRRCWNGRRKEKNKTLLGRLLIFTRQLDMLMTTEGAIEWAAENFVAGNYKLIAPVENGQPVTEQAGG